MEEAASNVKARHTPVAVVMPCLNESSSLKASCQSLGFGVGENSDVQDQCLVIVDNGSQDDSVFIAEEIARTSPRGKVLLITEECRGHVPARSKGVFAARRHFHPDFIIQVDADTDYEPGYVSALWATGRIHGPGTLIEAQMDWPSDFALQNPTFIREIEELDQLIGTTFEGDVVIDDKGCAYWVDDYELWGGHCREYWSSGEEMLAETTRLFMRGLQFGAKRVLVNITARHSARNWYHNAAVELASAGFPMPPSWQNQWKKLGLKSLLIEGAEHEGYSSALAMRRKVLAALFIELPKLVNEGLSPARAGSFLNVHQSSPEPADLIETSMRIAAVLK